MSIICGTDFSEMAAHAATAAACLAARTGSPLHLIHALDVQPEELRQRAGHPLLSWAESRLEREAERLRALGAEVHTRPLAGPADAVLQAAAREHAASAIVIGALGQRRGSLCRLGSRADQTARAARVPVVTVRESASFAAWAREGRPLRVVLGIDDSQSVEAAARWVDPLCKAGPVELILAHLYWPPEAFRRFGLQGTRSFVDPDPELVQALEQQLSRRLTSLLHAKLKIYRIEPHLGRLGDGLAGLAAEARADLLVVGSRARPALERFWEGSVARQALHAATMSVACVPGPAAAQIAHTPRLSAVLAATDFSELGNGAIPLAYAAASPGGIVHLLHVVSADGRRGVPSDVFQGLGEATPEAMKAAETRLLELVPADASARHIATRVYAFDSNDASDAICQTAERLDVDLICLGTHGRSGLATATLGSVASHVLTHSRRPLLLARGPRP